MSNKVEDLLAKSVADPNFAQDIYHQDRERIVAFYQKNPKDYVAAWAYLENHPIFTTLDGVLPYFHRSLCTAVVSPRGKLNKSKTKTKWFKKRKTLVTLECGPVYFAEDAPEGFFSPEDVLHEEDGNTFSIPHDIKLDCGARSHKKAVIKLARNVKKHYGDDRSRVYRDNN